MLHLYKLFPIFSIGALGCAAGVAAVSVSARVAEAENRIKKLNYDLIDLKYDLNPKISNLEKKYIEVNQELKSLQKDIGSPLPSATAPFKKPS